MKRLPTVKRILDNPSGVLVCFCALAFSYFTTAKIIDGLLVLPSSPTFDIVGTIPAASTGEVSFKGTATMQAHSSAQRATDLLQAGLISFGLLAAVFYTVAALGGENADKMKQIAHKLLTGVMFLFLPVAIEWTVGIYVRPPVPWSAPWLIPLVVLLWIPFCGLLWFATTLLFSGLVNGMQLVWRQVTHNPTKNS